MDFDSCWDRIKANTDIKKMSELAEIVGMTQPTVSKSKKKDVFPPEWAYAVGVKYDLLTEWIMSGKGPKRLSEYQTSEPLNAPPSQGDSKGERIHFDFLYEIDEWLVELVKKEPYRKDWFKGFFMDVCKPFAEWKKSRDKEGGSRLAGEE